MSDQPQEGGNDGKIDKRSANYRAGYQDGRNDTLRGNRPSLFEAAKTLVSRHRHEPLHELGTMLDELEGEYGSELSKPDRDLVLAIARRHQTSGSAREQAVLDLVRPRRPRTLPEDRAETVYEPVA